jgi:predicted acylesterase/phospholipase RssA
MRLGLAFSGGGSRAAGFHRGTLDALFKIGILTDEKIEKGEVAVSSVSGGTVFAAAWLAAIADKDKKSRADFLMEMKEELKKGFISRTIRPRLLKAVLPGYSRSHAFAKTFDKIFFKGKTLKDLPQEPPISINTSILNNGQVGKFSRDGFRAASFLKQTKAVLPDFPLAMAVMASAAFPVGLPPVYLKQKKHIPKNLVKDEYRKHKRIALSDGGVLENLGLQTLLLSGEPFKSWDIISSDAGAPLKAWKPGKIMEKIMGVGMGIVSAPIIKRVTILMNDKENRHMRSRLFEELEKTWLVSGINNPNVAKAPGMQEYIKNQPPKNRRQVLFLYIDQNWRDFFYNMPQWRMVELMEFYKNRTGNQAIPLPPQPKWYSPDEEKEKYTHEIVKILKKILDTPKADRLVEAEKVYTDMGKEEAVEKIKRISTGFSGLSEEKLKQLYDHAYWQVMASYATYWD